MAARDAIPIAQVSDIAGRWRDESGRELAITPSDGAARVSVTRAGQPYRIHLLVGHTETVGLPARLSDGVLVVEAGTPDIGPTYRLALDTDGALIPSVGIGLYDDFDDDLGVPWAFPLSPYRRSVP